MTSVHPSTGRPRGYRTQFVGANVSIPAAGNRLAQLFLFAAALVLRSLVVNAQQADETYYVYINDHPQEASVDWAENDGQGLTHDADAWFITQQYALWKVPVTVDLAQDLGPLVGSGEGDVKRLRLNDAELPELSGYDHFGDPDYYELSGTGYVLVPVEDNSLSICSGPVLTQCGICSDFPRLCCPCLPAALAVFRASDLGYVKHASFYETAQTSAGWLAVDPAGVIYTSDGGDISSFWRYSVNWPCLEASCALVLTLNPNPYNLLTETGGLAVVNSPQGGVISPSGGLFYFSAGYIGDLQSSWGIHVFELATHRRVQKSTNGGGYFEFTFDPSSNEEEPEGLTIWDLDNVPNTGGGVRGQLHVMLVDNDNETFDADDVYIKHYTDSLSVDRSYVGIERGTWEKPFNTVGEAHGAAWMGAGIRIKGGIYPEIVTLSKKMSVYAEGGLVSIGR